MQTKVEQNQSKTYMTLKVRVFEDEYICNKTPSPMILYKQEQVHYN